MLNLTRADNGKFITMQVNDLLGVSLDENPTTGFQWALDSGGGDWVKLQASEYITAAGSGVGGGGQRVLTFKAQRAGTGRLQLKLWREWEGEPSIVERFTVTLQVRE
jgi:inhibitor of cysteine peptidase